MNTNLKKIGERIDSIVKKTGISRDGLGEIIGVKSGAVGRQIRGETDPGTIALVKIAKFGNVSLDWLITGEEQPFRQKETPLDDLFAQVVSQPKVMQKIMDQVRSQVREEQTAYAKGQQISPHEIELIENYRAAEEGVREGCFEMIKSSAAKLRANDGGGSNSTEMKSA